MSWQGFSQRKFPRIGFSCDIELKTEGENKSSLGRMKNIGAGGLCLLTSKELSVYEEVHVEFTLPQGASSSLKCLGRVMWTIPTEEDGQTFYDVGIEFVALKKKDKDYIEQAIALLAKSENF